MTTVINQTHVEVSLNRAHLQKVETVVNNMFEQMVLTELSLTKTVSKVSTLEEEVIVDRLLEALESVHNLWLRHAIDGSGHHWSWGSSQRRYSLHMTYDQS